MTSKSDRFDDGGKCIITVGTSGADYDNFEDAIDFLRGQDGGTIIVITDMVITSTDVKDLTNITIEGDQFYSGTRQISKTAASGYWYGKNVTFKNIWFYRLLDTGANEIFKYTEDYQDVTLKSVNLLGLAGLPVVFDCNGKEAHIVAEYMCLLGAQAMGWVGFSATDTLILHLFDRSGVYLTGNVDACFYDSSCGIEGSPTFLTPGHPVKMDKASAMDNDSSVTGDTVKDALENLTEKNGVSGVFTTVDGKTVTVTDGQITNIV